MENVAAMFSDWFLNISLVHTHKKLHLDYSGHCDQRELYNVCCCVHGKPHWSQGTYWLESQHEPVSPVS